MVGDRNSINIYYYRVELCSPKESYDVLEKDIDVLDLLVRAGEDDYLSDDEVEILKFIG